MAKGKYKNKKGAKNKSGKDTRKENIINNSETLQEIYDRLDSMSEEERQTKINEISEKLSNMEHDIASNFMDLAEASDEELKLEADKFAEATKIAKEGAKLRKEKRQIENFPMVKDRIKKIVDLQNEMIERKKEEIEKIEASIESMKQHYEEQSKKLEELDEEIANVQKALDYVKSEKAKSAILEEIQELEDKKKQN